MGPGRPADDRLHGDFIPVDHGIGHGRRRPAEQRDQP